MPLGTSSIDSIDIPPDPAPPHQNRVEILQNPVCPWWVHGMLSSGLSIAAHLDSQPRETLTADTRPDFHVSLRPTVPLSHVVLAAMVFSLVNPGLYAA